MSRLIALCGSVVFILTVHPDGAYELYMLWYEMSPLEFINGLRGNGIAAKTAYSVHSGIQMPESALLRTNHPGRCENLLVLERVSEGSERVSVHQSESL